MAIPAATTPRPAGLRSAEDLVGLRMHRCVPPHLTLDPNTGSMRASMGRTLRLRGAPLHRVRGASCGWAVALFVRDARPTLPYAERAGRTGPTPASGLAIEPAGTHQQPGQALARAGADGPAGRPSAGWIAWTTGSRSAVRASLMVARQHRARRASRAPGSASSGPRPASAAHRRGRQDPRGQPLAEVELLGPGDGERHDRRVGPQRDDRPAGPEWAGPSGRTADRALGHLDEDAAVGHHGPRRGDVLIDPDPAAPHGSSPPR